MAYLNKLRRLGLTISECQNNFIFSKRAFHKEFSYEFIEYVKLGKIHDAYRLLEKNKYLVHDFDWVYLTPQHWACKRNQEDIVKMLLMFNSDVNAKDILGRTPQYFALLHQNQKIVKLLLLNEANPWSSPSDCNYKDICENNGKIIPFLQKARELVTVLNMTPASIRRDVWVKEASIHFKNYDKMSREEEEFWKFMNKDHFIKLGK